MTSFGWLNELMLWIGKWFPRFVLIKAGNAGVLFGLNGRTRPLAPGLYWYWPITSEIQIVSVRARTSEINCQLHGREVISVVVAYTITDPVAMLLHFSDVFSQLDDRTQAWLGAAYNEKTSSAAIGERIFDAMKTEFGAHGVTVHRVDVVQRGFVIALKNIGDWAQHAPTALA